MSNITLEQKEELRNWLRPMSPLAAFSKTLRNEGESGASQTPDASKQAEDAQKIVDHFEGVDLDELPENARKAITSAREYITTSQKTLQTTEERRVKAENFARSKQGEADKLRGIVQKHNLSVDGSQTLPSDKHAQRVDRFIKQHNLKPEAAEVYAKLFESESEGIKKEIISELGPLAGAVGSIQANQLLGQARDAHATLFAVPEIAKNVSDNVQAMVNAGNSVNAETISHLLEMAVGSYHMKNPEKPLSGKSDNNGGLPNFAGLNVSNGSHANRSEGSDDKSPRVTQPETAKMISGLQQEFRQGLPTKAKK